MKRIWRWALITCLALALVLTGGFLGRDKIFKIALEKELTRAWGSPTQVDRVESAWGSSGVRLHHVTIYNSPEFGGSKFIDIPEADVDCDWFQLASHKFHFKSLRIRIAELHIVQNAAGKDNVTQLLLGLLSDGQSGKHHRSRSDRPFQGIDRLELTIERIRWTDLKSPASSEVRILKHQTESRTNVIANEDFMAILLSLALRNGITFEGDPLSKQR